MWGGGALMSAIFKLSRWAQVGAEKLHEQRFLPKWKSRRVGELSVEKFHSSAN